MLTEIYLCHACSCQEMLRAETAGQVASDPSEYHELSRALPGKLAEPRPAQLTIAPLN